MTSENRFYVYTLSRPDGTVFYVGKGTGYRMDDHERDAKRGEQSHKCHIIRKIWREGGTVQKQKAAFFDTEEEAYQHEMHLIATFGMTNLANCSTGGEGRGAGYFGPSGEFTRTTLPLEQKDREAIAAIREHYGLHSDADAIRMSIHELYRKVQKAKHVRKPNTLEDD
jgi:hypothetical protein